MIKILKLRLRNLDNKQYVITLSTHSVIEIIALKYSFLFPKIKTHLRGSHSKHFFVAFTPTTVMSEIVNRRMMALKEKRKNTTLFKC